MGILNVFRATAFGITFFFSIVILAFDGLRLAVFQLTPYGKANTGLSMTATILNILIVITTFLFEKIFKSGTTSLVPIELARTGILWILWLATAGYQYSRGAAHASDCSFYTGYPLYQVDCGFVIFGPVLAIFNFIILLAWFMTVLIYSIKGNHWKSPVHKFDLRRKRADILEAQARQPTAPPYLSGKTPGSYYPQQQAFYPQQQAYWVPAQQMQNQLPPQGYWVVPGPAPPGVPQIWPQQGLPQQPAQEAQSPPMLPSRDAEKTHTAEGAVPR